MFIELCYYLYLPLCVDGERFVYTQLGFIAMYSKINSSASSVMHGTRQHYVSVRESEQLIWDSDSSEAFRFLYHCY
jgi:hypothetical protein